MQSSGVTLELVGQSCEGPSQADPDSVASSVGQLRGKIVVANGSGRPVEFAPDRMRLTLPAGYSPSPAGADAQVIA